MAANREQGRSRLVLGYDGTAFSGWAAQPGMRTVESELTHAMRVLLRREVPLTVAGRTDTGVHAEAQVVSHPGPPADRKSLNAILPPDVVVLSSESADDSFDARADATSRAYGYRIAPGPVRPLVDRGHAWWVLSPFDPDLLDACAALLPGSHDLTAFTPTRTLHRHFERRILSARWLHDGDRLEFRIEAESFLRHMNRILVGTMIEVAKGEMSVEQFAELLEGRPRLDAGPTAPPRGLRLIGVGYGTRVLGEPGDG